MNGIGAILIIVFMLVLACNNPGAAALVAILLYGADWFLNKRKP